MDPEEVARLVKKLTLTTEAKENTLIVSDTAIKETERD